MSQTTSFESQVKHVCEDWRCFRRVSCEISKPFHDNQEHHVAECAGEEDYLRDELEKEVNERNVINRVEASEE